MKVQFQHAWAPYHEGKWREMWDHLKLQAFSMETFLGADSVLDVLPALTYAEEPQYPLDTDWAVPRNDLKVAETQEILMLLGIRG